MSCDDIADRCVPFTQAILNRGKLCELTLPVREIPECLEFSVLIKIAIMATSEVFNSTGCQRVPRLVPEFGIVARFIPIVPKLEIGISSLCDPFGVVFAGVEIGRIVQVAFEPDKVAESVS